MCFYPSTVSVLYRLWLLTVHCYYKFVCICIFARSFSENAREVGNWFVLSTNKFLRKMFDYQNISIPVLASHNTPPHKKMGYRRQHRMDLLLLFYFAYAVKISGSVR